MKPNRWIWKYFTPANRVVERYCTWKFGKSKATDIVSELSTVAFDMLADSYAFPNEVRKEYYDIIQSINYQLAITPYMDYEWLRAMDCRKYLVTTGVKRLQEAKKNGFGYC